MKTQCPTKREVERGKQINTRHQKFRVKTYLSDILSRNKIYSKRGMSGLGSCLILLPRALRDEDISYWLHFNKLCLGCRVGPWWPCCGRLTSRESDQQREHGTYCQGLIS